MRVNAKKEMANTCRIPNEALSSIEGNNVKLPGCLPSPRSRPAKKKSFSAIALNSESVFNMKVDSCGGKRPKKQCDILRTNADILYDVIYSLLLLFIMVIVIAVIIAIVVLVEVITIVSIITIIIKITIISISVIWF